MIIEFFGPAAAGMTTFAHAPCNRLNERGHNARKCWDLSRRLIRSSSHCTQEVLEAGLFERPRLESPAERLLRLMLREPCRDPDRLSPRSLALHGW